MNMGFALEEIGWGTAEHWMRMQAIQSVNLHHGASRSRPELAVARWLVCAVTECQLMC